MLNWKNGVPFFILAGFMAWFFFAYFPAHVERIANIKKEKLKNLPLLCKNLSENAQISTKALCNKLIPWNEITHPIEEYEQRKEDGGV